MKRLVLSAEAYRVLCGLLAPEEMVVSAEVRADPATWSELAHEFPAHCYDLLFDEWAVLNELSEPEIEERFGSWIRCRAQLNRTTG